MAENNDSGRISMIAYKSVLFIIQISNFPIITEQMPCSKKVKLKNIHFFGKKIADQLISKQFQLYALWACSPASTDDFKDKELHQSQSEGLEPFLYG